MERKNFSNRLKPPLNAYLLEFVNLEEAERLSNLNKLFKRSFILLLNNLKTLDSRQFKDRNTFFSLIERYNFVSSLRELYLVDLKGLNSKETTYLKFSLTYQTNMKKLVISNTILNEVSNMISNMKNLLDLNISNCPSLEFKILSLENCPKLISLKLSQIYLEFSEKDLERIYCLKNLQHLDLSKNENQNICILISKNIQNWPSLEFINFSENSITELVAKDLLNSLKKSNLIIKLNLRMNYLRGLNDSFISDFKNLIVDLDRNTQLIKAPRIMRMLFSRSAIVDSQCSMNRIIGKKSNESILPLIIYSNPSKIEITKDQLIGILRYENQIRLSFSTLNAFDNQKMNGVQNHLQFDKQSILEALQYSGYNPNVDDSLKAYHLATTKFINDPEVQNQVVWMKYDKCQIGKFSVGNNAVIDDIYLYTLQKEKVLFKNLLCDKRPNLIVSGSIS